MDRVRLIKESVVLNSSQIGNGGKFYICIEAIDSKRGTVSQMFQLTISHSQNVEDYYVPSEIINFSADSSFASQKKPVDGTISFKDENISGIKVYRRSLFEPFPTSFSRFVSIIDTDFKNIKRAQAQTARAPKFGIDFRLKGRVDLLRALTVSQSRSIASPGTSLTLILTPSRFEVV